MIENIDCFGWFADCCALNKDGDCPKRDACKNDWIKSGGRLGGIFDKIMDINNRKV